LQSTSKLACLLGRCEKSNYPTLWLSQQWLDAVQMAFQIKRAYGPAKQADGACVLINRLWPRGVKKSAAHLALWMKEVALSSGLRVWFGHKSERFAEFRRRYELELTNNPALGRLRAPGRGKLVTLVYAARDPTVSYAVVLQSILRARRPAGDWKSSPRNSHKNLRGPQETGGAAPNESETRVGRAIPNWLPCRSGN
jgi:uncharacterized protein YeaO (DUF488 family)